MPPRNLGDFLVTDWAESLLLFPEVKQPLFPFQVCSHAYVQTLFIVAFPCRVVGVSFASNLHMSFDRGVGSLGQVSALPIDLSIEHPVVSSDGLEVFPRNPFVGFVWVSSVCPASYHLVDRLIY